MKGTTVDRNLGEPVNIITICGYETPETEECTFPEGHAGPHKYEAGYVLYPRHRKEVTTVNCPACEGVALEHGWRCPKRG